MSIPRLNLAPEAPLEEAPRPNAFRFTGVEENRRKYAAGRVI